MIDERPIEIGAEELDHFGKLSVESCVLCGVHFIAERARKPRVAQHSTLNSHHPMKSAYELAMERLEKKSPTVTLTEKQKTEIAEIEATFRAKIAEREVFLQDQIAKARFDGKDGEVLELED